MSVLVAALVAAAVLLWPRTDLLPRSRAPDDAPVTRPADALVAAARGATSTEVADALTLLGLALRSGCGPVEALEDVAARVHGSAGSQLRAVAAAHRWGLDPAACWRYAPPVWTPAALAWQAALTAGVSPAALVERAAEVLRDDDARRVETALARAGVLLVLPLGVCFLPGFVATTVVPIVAQLLAGFAGGL